MASPKKPHNDSAHSPVSSSRTDEQKIAFDALDGMHLH